MSANRREAAWTRRQQNSRRNQFGWRDRRSEWRRRWLEELEDRALLDANFNKLPTAMDDMLTALQTTVNDEIFNVNLPIVADGLKSLPADSQLLADLRQDFKNEFQNQPKTADGVQNALQSALTNDLHWSGTVGVTGKGTDNVTFTVPLMQPPTALAEKFDFHTGLLADVTNLHDNQNNPVQPVQVDLGLNPSGNAVSQLVFEVTPSDVLLDATDTKLSLHVHAALPNLSGAHGTLAGLLPVVVADGPNATNVGLQKPYDASDFHGDFNLGLPSGNVSWMNSLQGKSGALEPGSTVDFVNGNAGINLALAIDSTQFVQGEGNFPSMGADLAIDWTFNNLKSNAVTNAALPGDGKGAGNVPTVAFNDVQLEIGSFFSRLVAPAIAEVQKVTKPLQPVVDALQKPIPVLSDLSNLVHQGDVTLESLITKETGDDTLKTFDDAVNFLNNLVTVQSGESLNYYLGSFNINGLNGIDPRTQALNLATASITKAADKLTVDLGNNHPIDVGDLAQFGPYHEAADQNGGGPLVRFPILEKPASAFGILLGQDVGLVTVDLVDHQTFAEPKFSKFYPIFGPLGIQINGSLECKANFDFGYDTYGLLQKKPLEGFFVVSDKNYRDFDGTVRDDQAGLTFDAKLDAGPGINVVVASVNVTGGIEGKAALSLNSPVNDPPGKGSNISGDGRIRPQDFAADEAQNGVFGFLQASGEVDAFLNFHAQVGVSPFDASYDKVLAKAVLIDFNFGGNANHTFLAGAGTAKADSTKPGAFTFNNPNNPGQLILNMGPYAKFRDTQSPPADGDEDFSVTYVGTDPNNANAEIVEVSAFGFVQQYEGLTSIYAEGGLGNNTITIDQGVKVPVTLYASYDPKDPNYQNLITQQALQTSHNVLQAGGGNATLVGGQGVDGKVAYYLDTNKTQPVYAGDDLIGGSANNHLYGGDAQAGTINHETLVGGTQAASMNTLGAGNGGDNTMLAGPNGDSLTGNFTGNDTFVAGAGDDQMTGGAGTNVFEWQEGDGNPTITAFGSNNTLQAVGFTAADQFHAQAKSGTLTLTVTIPVSGQPPIQRSLQATGIQTLTLDDGSGGTSYEIDDLAGTSVQQVNLNLHEVGNTDGAADQITVKGSPTVANTVDISANPNVLAGNSFSYDSSGNPIASQPVYGEATNVDMTIAFDDFTGSPPAHYVITAAIPKNADQLRVTTGKANDTVSVESTQGTFSDNTDPAGNGQPPDLGGSVFVSTVGGDNTINVGTAAPGTGEGLLDRIQGNLYIDSGTGTKNVLNLDESLASNGDTLALTSSLAGSLAYQLLRYTGEDLSSNPDGGGGAIGLPGEKNRYPMLIQYDVDAGGGYGGGINLYLARPLTQTPNTLYVTDTFPLARTTVYTDGKLFPGVPNDKIVVGFNPLDANNPAHSPETSMLSNTPGMPDNLLGPLDIEGTDWAHNTVGGVDLAVYDEAAAANSSYTLTGNSVERFGVTPITYNDLGISTVPGSVALFAANAANTISVPSTAAYTPATVGTGSATSGINVGFPVLPQQYVLDAIQGALTINGGGTANLTLNDAANLAGGTYNLNATTLQRLGGVAIAPIHFSKMTTLDLYEAGQASNMTNVSGTAAGTAVNVHTGDGTDGLTVSTLDQVLGRLAFVWKNGIKSLVADDTSAAGVDKYAVGPSVLKRTGAADIIYDPLATLELDTSSVQDANVDIPAINSGTQEKIFAGAGANRITAASGGQNLNAIQGGLQVNGGGNTSLRLEDQNAATARSCILTAGEFQAASVPPQPPMIAPVDFVNLSSLTLDSGNQGNTTDVNGTAAGNHVTVNAGTGDSVTIGNATSSLNPILGRVDVVGVGTGDNLTIVDTKGNPMSLYTLTASELDHPLTAPIGY
ncbi:MAG TPA: hypothetical protein VG125_08560, partial [Pirellulales bacterium]|nr:hypothetical protein [Pirellulales bacterium]